MSRAHQSSDGGSAVAVLAQKRNPKAEEFRGLCSAWGVPRREGGGKAGRKERPIPTLTVELRQAVLAEGTRLRARGLAAQLGGSGREQR